MKEFNFRINEVENGYVLSINEGSGYAATQTYVEKDAEGVRDRILAMMVTEKLKPAKKNNTVSTSSTNTAAAAAQANYYNNDSQGQNSWGGLLGRLGL
jgi:hypothetical protein